MRRILSMIVLSVVTLACFGCGGEGYQTRKAADPKQQSTEVKKAMSDLSTPPAKKR